MTILMNLGFSLSLHVFRPMTYFTQIYIKKINHRTENRGQERNVNVGGLNIP
jgi:hypothetical protein